MKKRLTILQSGYINLCYLLCFFAFLLFSNTVLAACTPSLTNTTINLSTTTINVPLGVTPGTPLGPVMGPYDSTVAALGNCGFVPYMFLSLNSTLASSSIPYISETGFPGVGIKVWSTFLKTTNVTNIPTYFYQHNTTGGTAYVPSVYIQFYATGKIRSGSVSLPSPLLIATTSSSSTGIVNGADYVNISVGNSVYFNAPDLTCTVSNPNQTITLPTVNAKDLKSNGAGKYPAAMPFNLFLNCNPQTTVSVKFEGNSMAGSDDVLANTSSGNDSVGVQMVFNNTPVKWGQDLLVINSAQAQESLTFNAHYYYNGGDISGGSVTSVTTFTFSYN